MPAPTEELQFQVVVDDKLEREVQGAVVAFGEFISEDALIYKTADAFYADLILGRAMPLTFVTKGIDSAGAIVAVSLFLHRDLALHPTTSTLVMAARLIDSFGTSGMAHIDRDLAGLFQVSLDYMSNPNHTKQVQQGRLAACVSWIREYVLNGRFPVLPLTEDPPRIIDRGTDGFVVAEGIPSQESWLELYRMGFLRGVIFSQPKLDRRWVSVAKKSAYISMALDKAASILNDVEASMGEPRGWYTDGVWLLGPEDGTLLPVSSVLNVLTRV